MSIISSVKSVIRYFHSKNACNARRPSSYTMVNQCHRNKTGFLNATTATIYFPMLTIKNITRSIWKINFVPDAPITAKIWVLSILKGNCEPIYYIIVQNLRLFAFIVMKLSSVKIMICTNVHRRMRKALILLLFIVKRNCFRRRIRSRKVWSTKWTKSSIINLIKSLPLMWMLKAKQNKLDSAQQENNFIKDFKRVQAKTLVVFTVRVLMKRCVIMSS